MQKHGDALALPASLPAPLWILTCNQVPTSKVNIFSLLLIIQGLYLPMKAVI